ncbi:hypothetical protein ACP3W1_28055, partial [Salmonella enterica]|uniref:hypothetical protein n=1 Tax=Salmonella enterica TaxID=28901 RepID=UPI003CED229D
ATPSAGDNAGDARLTDIGAGNLTLSVPVGAFGRNLSYSKVNGGNIAIGTGLSSVNNGTIAVSISGGAGSITDAGGNL